MINHLAIIMDGNRRWAKRLGFNTWKGHQEGVNTLKEIIEEAIVQKIKHLSLYTFSLENFKRSETEKNFLFDLIIEQSEKILPDLLKNGVRIFFIGDKSKFPERTRAACESLEENSSQCDNINVYILFCYGGRQEIVAATKNIIEDINSGKIKTDNITDETFKKYLWINKISSSEVPDPDLIIRTGGVIRLSNFLLYEAAYSELYFTDILWPDFKKNDLLKAIEVFNERKRNFGA